MNRLIRICVRRLHDQPSIPSTIYALASGRGKSGVAVIRISGANSEKIIQEMTKSQPFPSPRVAALRTFCDPKTEEKLDKGLLLWMPGPKSFTGEDVAEFHIHGGPAVISAVLDGLGQFAHTRQAEPGEFTKRAFLNGRIDLIEAEAIADLVHAQTTAQRRQALRQMEGTLGQKYQQWRQSLLKSVAYLEAHIDFGEEEALEENTVEKAKEMIALVEKEMKAHLNDHRRGERLRSGVRVTIVGEPNVGKSTLMNLISQRPAAIVSPIAGTTRDIIESSIDLGGYPVLISDTAGLRRTEDCVEKEGVIRAVDRASISDVVVIVLDIQQFTSEHLPTTEELIQNRLEEHQLLLEKDQKILLFFNKCDLISPELVVKIRQFYPESNVVSCANQLGVGDFLNALTRSVEGLCGDPLAGDVNLTSQRHRQHLEQCVQRIGMFREEMRDGDVDMATHDVQQALRQLGKISGRVYAEEILDVIFKDFCIGK